MKKIILAICIVLLITNGSIFAFENKNIEFEKDTAQSTYRVLESEKNTFETFIKKNISNNNKIYYFDKFTVESENNNNIEQIITVKKENLKTNDKEKLTELFGSEYKFDNNEFTGCLPIDNIDVKIINNGTHEELWEENEDFKDYTINELDNIPKEKIVKGITYKLLNVDFIETLDKNGIPILFSGKKIYKAVVIIKNIDTYDVTVTYKGNIARKDKAYIYNVEYKDIPVMEVVVISGLGLVIVIIYMFLRSNIKIYNYTKKGYKLLLKKKLKDYRIDMTNKSYKIESNMYKIKLNKKLFKKMNNRYICIKLEHLEKTIRVESREILFTF